jgi:hypothetical protein
MSSSLLDRSHITVKIRLLSVISCFIYLSGRKKSSGYYWHLEFLTKLEKFEISFNDKHNLRARPCGRGRISKVCCVKGKLDLVQTCGIFCL